MAYWTTWGPGAVLAGIGILAIMVKVLRILFRLDAALPTLLSIAEEFKPNGGNSLKDHLNRFAAEMHDHTSKDDERFAEIASLIKGEGQSIRQKQDVARDVAAATKTTVVNVTAKPA